MVVQGFVIYALAADRRFSCIEKSKGGVMVHWEFTPLLCLMLQMSFRRYSNNDCWEPKHLSVVCKWFQTLIKYIMPPHDFLRVCFSLFMSNFRVSLLLHLLWYFHFPCLESVVSTRTQKSKEEVRTSWENLVYSSTIFLFGLDGSFLTLVHHRIWVCGPWLKWQNM